MNLGELLHFSCECHSEIALWAMQGLGNDDRDGIGKELDVWWLGGELMRRGCL